MLTDEELLELLRGGETDRVEFTADGEGMGADEKIRRNVCAFANDLPGRGKPGVLFIGVNDDGSCAGARITKTLLEKLSELRLNAGIHPFPVALPERKTLDGCEMAVVTTAPSHSPPVRYNGDIWVRVGPTCRKATRAEEMRLIERRSGKPATFDTVAAFPPAGLRDLIVGAFHEYLEMAVSPAALAENDRTDEERLKSMGFMTPDGEANYAALLCFGKQPQKWLGGAYIQFLRCPGTDIVSAAEAVDHKEFRGTIFQQIREIESMMRAHNQTPAIIGHPHRVDFPAYPIVALQQAIRNAVLHRTYEGTNAPVHCRWFSDRVEIISPGGPYGLVTPDNFGREDITDYRNLQLAQAMKDMEFIERYGFGIRAIRREMARNGNPPPEFRAHETTATVVLRRLDWDALVARAAELACCRALFQFRRDWDANPGAAHLVIFPVSRLNEHPGFPEAATSPTDGRNSAKAVALAAARVHAGRRAPTTRVARILRELFGAAEDEIREVFKASPADAAADEAPRPSSLEELETDIEREAMEDRMRALLARR